MSTIRYKYWDPDLVVDSVEELIACYDRGLAGVIPDPRSREELRSGSTFSSFEAAASANQLQGTGKGQLSVPFIPTQRLNPLEWPGVGQGTGCCASRALINAATLSYGYEVWNGLPDERKAQYSSDSRDSSAVAEEWPVVPDPSQQTFDHVTVYGERGHRGQGASASEMAVAVRDRVGLLPRGSYNIPGYGRYDCSEYNDRAAARSGPHWGSAFRKFTHKHVVRDVTSVDIIEEARDALANGFGITCGSGFGCASQRPAITDSHGNTCAGPNRRTKRWLHAMAWIACDDRPWAHSKYGGPLFLVQNSWGGFNSGPRRIYDTDIEIPVGSFWITYREAKWMLSWDDTVAVSCVKGFPRTSLIWW